MRKYTVFFLGLALLVAVAVSVGCAPTAPALGTEGDPIVLAFVPSGEAPDIIASAETVADLLEEETGYAIEGSVAQEFLTRAGADFTLTADAERLSPTDLAAQASQATVLIECLK